MAENGTVVIGTVNKIEKPGHREDFVLRVVKNRNGTPAVELRVWVDNQTTKPAFKGLVYKGGYFRMSPDQFNELVKMAPKVKEAIKASVQETGDEEKGTGAIPEVPNFNTLAGVTAD